MHKSLLSLLFLFVSISLSATDYYVSPSGNNENDGSEASPFLTITKAASLMVAGDICYIKAGVYRETLRTSSGGTAAAPITFRAFGDGEVILSATEPLTGWSLHEGAVYKASVEFSLGRQNMLYVNGEPMEHARWPNNADQDPFTIDAMTVTGGTAGTIQATELPDFNLREGYIWYLGAHSGTSWTRTISSTSGKNISFEEVDINRWPFNPHNPTIFRNGNRGRFYVFGALSLLDTEREWYFDAAANEVYLQAPGNTDPKTLTVEYAARAKTVEVNHPYVTLEGITTFGGIVNLKGEYAVFRDGQILHGLQAVDELDNTDAQISEGAIHVQASNVLIDGNLIEGGSMTGVSVQGWGGVSNATISNNVIREFNTVGNHSSPIRCRAPESKILNNTIIGGGRDGLFVPANNCEIAWNDVSDCMRINNDGGMFYVVGNDEDKNTSVHHNWFHDSFGPDYADGRCAGIYLDNDSKGYDVHHNVVWNISWSAVQMNWDAWNNDIFNNTFWNTDQAMGIWLNGRIQKDNRVWNNYSDVAPWEGQSEENNIINATDQFEDVANANFMPGDNSVLIGAGRVIPGITDDARGAPEVGAYEKGTFRWIPGAPQAGGMTTAVSTIPASRVRAQISPNPAGNITTLSFDAPAAGPFSWQLITSTGQIVRQRTNLSLTAGPQRLSISTDGLPSATYLLIGQLQEGLFTQRIMVVK